ncbi:MAG TPA: hypothetical protein VHF87_08245 [Methylomirabilota bacterium]|nr:hypothetical protein [Methylomirabilota bacterium]
MQSFLAAAALTTIEGDVNGALAAALSVEPLAVRDGVGYVARQEYSAVDPNAVSALAGRTLSIVANESAGQKIFSIKGKDFFSTTVNANIRPRVTALRAALTAASHGKLPEEYRYDDGNNGKAPELFALLWDLASSGWDLWSLLVPPVDRQEEVRKLLGNGGIVTAAHVDLAEAVPWSLIYDQCHPRRSIRRTGPPHRRSSMR